MNNGGVGLQTPGAALLVLEDGMVFAGEPFGARGTTVGEVVFNTSMTGYQEILTDPSYHRQIVAMTAPHIGNYGTNAQDDESDRAWAAGFCTRSASPVASNWRSTATLDEYLNEARVVSITELDTRALVRHVRERGAMRAALSNVGLAAGELLAMARSAPNMNGLDLCREVTCDRPYVWSDAGGLIGDGPTSGGAIASGSIAHGSITDGPITAVGSLSGFPGESSSSSDGPRGGALFNVVALDFGIKRNALRRLARRGCRVTVLPATSTAEQVLGLQPDGVFLSSGPGDPAAVTYAHETIRGLLGRVPIFGICMGHQLMALALGGRTYKLKFGHRGGNQPVRVDGRVEISAHNHGFAVDAASLPASVQVSHLNLNDGCVEGLRVPDLDAFSVQYHPEAAPGPHDSDGLFDAFADLMGRRRR